jgi:hypothetical protein
MFLMIIGCDKDNPIISESEGDKLLYQQIIGTWTDGSKSTNRYYADRSFIDSVYQHYSDGSDDVFKGVVQGTYRILNGVLYYNDIKVKYTDEILNIYAQPDQISINGNKMDIKNVRILSPIQQYNSNIYGDWTRTIWFAYRSGNTNLVNEGYITETYSFYNDSNYYRVKQVSTSQNGIEELSYDIQCRILDQNIIINSTDTIQFALKYNQLYIYPFQYVEVLTKKIDYQFAG